jgi:hypothetical protein
LAGIRELRGGEMNMFGKKETAMSEEITGVTVLRQTVKSRNKSPTALTLIASEIDGVGSGRLEDFANGKADLSTAQLQALAKILYPHSEYDPESGKLRPANREEPKKLCTAYPEPATGSAPVVSTGIGRGFVPETPPPPQPSKPAGTRPGWAA